MYATNTNDSARPTYIQTEPYNNRNDGPPVFPINIKNPYIRKDTDPTGLEDFLNRGDIPQTCEEQLQLASWCARHCIENADEAELEKALSHLISTSKIDNFLFDDLTENGVSRLIPLLEKHKTITSIAFSQCKITATQVMKLLENASIRSLYIYNSGLSPADGKIIGDALKNNTTLTELALPSNKLGPIGVAAICNALQSNTTIQKLVLSGNHFGPHPIDGLIGVEAVAQLLKKNTSLLKINLSYNDLFSAGSGLIFDALKHNKTLKTIHLFDTRICEMFQCDPIQHVDAQQIIYDPDIYKKIADMFWENKHLETINLGRIPFGPNGLFQVMEGLIKNNTLRNLLLGYQYRDHLEVAAITNMLMHNTGLQFLSLAFSTLQTEHAQVLSEVLQSNSCKLESLDLYGNYISLISSGLAEALKKPTSSLYNINIECNGSLLDISAVNKDNRPYIDEIENACARNRNRAAIPVEAFLQSALTVFFQSWNPYDLTGASSSGKMAHSLAQDIASRIDPWLAFESNLPAVNTLAWKIANSAKEEAMKAIVGTLPADRGTKKSLLGAPFTDAFLSDEIDPLYSLRSEFSREEFFPDMKKKNIRPQLANGDASFL